MRPRPWLVLLALGLAALAVLVAWPPLRAGLVETGRLLAAGELAGVREHLRGFGPWAPLVAFALILGQAVVAPLPSFPVIYANGLLFGTLWGGLLSWVCVLPSAALCFGLARLWGRPLVERVLSPRAIRRADALFARYGVFAVLLGRLLPFTAFDP
ncbi:MAG: VTT domain-containing protein [Candidatus Rokubacteria bacterium]|nr:VTT domain-containing protein [Candidatus Rokubacteria bacterium]